MSQTEFNSFGFVIRNALSGIEGAFGLGFVLGTNLTIDMQTVIGGAVKNGTAYSLSYTDASGAAKRIDVLHDAGVPFQSKFPTDILITLDVPANALYAAYTETITIQPNTAPVMRPRISFIEAYARVTQILYL